jgi:hypothetical protein
MVPEPQYRCLESRTALEMLKKKIQGVENAGEGDNLGN